MNEIPGEADALNFGQLSENFNYKKIEVTPQSDAIEEEITEISETPFVTEDIFSSDFSKPNSDFPKFKSLKFGQDYNIQQDSDIQDEEGLKNVSGGAFGGLFRKNKLDD